MRGSLGVRAGHSALIAAQGDASPYVRIVAAEALARFGEPNERPPALAKIVELADWSQQDVFVAIAALQALDSLGEAGATAKATLRQIARKGALPHERYGEYVPRLLEAVK